MNKLERILGYPIFQIGVLVDLIRKQHNASGLFFFIPHYCTGGAEQVHLDILRIFAKEKPWVVLTHKSPNDYHKAAMQQCAEMFEIGKYYNNQNRFFVKNYFLGYYSSLLNRHPRAIIINSLCSFLYDLLPTLKTGYLIDIFHGFCGVNTDTIVHSTPALNRRILVSNSVRDELLAMYAKHGIDSKYNSRLVVIHNAVRVDDTPPAKVYEGELKVVFVGRNSQEKRYYLYERTALECKQQGLPIRFYSIGSFTGSEVVTCLGEIRTREGIYKALSEFHILILCSTSEGFGLVVAEAMACGVVPLATDCGGVAEIFADGETGHLIRSKNEADIVDKFVELLRHYAEATELLKPMALAAYNQVKANLSYTKFNQEYAALIEEARKVISDGDIRTGKRRKRG